MIDRFVRALGQAGLALEARQIADILWLAAGISVPEPVTPAVRPAPAPPPPVPAGGAKPLDTPPARAVTPEAATATLATRAQVFAAPQTAAVAGGMQSARRMRAAGVEALPDKPGLRLALRPLSRRRPSRARPVLDEEATVRAFADTGGRYVVPRFRSGSERWFELVLVYEDRAVTAVWTPVLRELASLLADHGAFRGVRTFRLGDRDGELLLTGETVAAADPRRLANAETRRIVLLASDCTGPAWRRGAMQRLVRTWAARSPVALIHLLPEFAWGSTWSGEAHATTWTFRPGAPNAALAAARPWWEPATGARLPIPVMPLAAAGVARWARSLMAVGGERCPAVLLDDPEPDEAGAAAAADAKTKGPGAAERIERFGALASPGARLLATHLSAAPLVLPVMRLVQRVVLPETGPAELGEVMLGGLVERVTPADAPAAPEAIHYDFAEGVRERLLSGLTGNEIERMRLLVGHHLRHETDRRYDFDALIADEAGEETLPAGLVPFAEVARLLERVVPRARARPTQADTGGGRKEAGVPIPIPETLQIPGTLREIEWSFDHRAMAILHAGGIDIETGIGSGEREHARLTNDIGRSTPDPVELWILMPATEGFGSRVDDLVARIVTELPEALAEGGRRTVIPVWREAQTTQGFGLALARSLAAQRTILGIGIIAGTNDAACRQIMDKLAHPAWGRAVRPQKPVAVLFEGALERSGDIRVLDWREFLVSEPDDAWRNRRFAAVLGELANEARIGLSKSESTVPGVVHTACTWLADGRLAVARTSASGQCEVNGFGAALQSLTPTSGLSQTIWKTDRPVVALSPLARAPAFTAADADGRMFMTKEGDTVSPIQDGLGLPRRLASSASGSTFAFTHHGGGLLVWGEGFTRLIVQIGETRIDAPGIVAFRPTESATGRRLYVFDDRMTARVYDLDTMALPPRTVSSGIDTTTWEQPFVHADVSPDGKLAAIAWEDGSLELLETDGWRSRARFTFDGEAGAGTARLAFSRDGTRLAIGRGTTVSIFEVATVLAAVSAGTNTDMQPGAQTPSEADAPAADLGWAIEVLHALALAWHVGDLTPGITFSDEGTVQSVFGLTRPEDSGDFASVRSLCEFFIKSSVASFLQGIDPFRSGVDDYSAAVDAWEKSSGGAFESIMLRRRLEAIVAAQPPGIQTGLVSLLLDKPLEWLRLTEAKNSAIVPELAATLRSPGALGLATEYQTPFHTLPWTLPNTLIRSRSFPDFLDRFFDLWLGYLRSAQSAIGDPTCRVGFGIPRTSVDAFNERFPQLAIAASTEGKSYAPVPEPRDEQEIRSFTVTLSQAATAIERLGELIRPVVRARPAITLPKPPSAAAA